MTAERVKDLLCALEIGKIKGQPGLEHSRVNVYDHKRIHLTTKLEAYMST